jgi:hypothetical protein
MEKKLTDTSFEVSEVITETKTTIYDYDFLISQKAQIEKDIIRNQAELAEVEGLIAKAKELGVKTSEEVLENNSSSEVI